MQLEAAAAAVERAVRDVLGRDHPLPLCVIAEAALGRVFVVVHTGRAWTLPALQALACTPGAVRVALRQTRLQAYVDGVRLGELPRCAGELCVVAEAQFADGPAHALAPQPSRVVAHVDDEWPVQRAAWAAAAKALGAKPDAPLVTQLARAVSALHGHQTPLGLLVEADPELRAFVVRRFLDLRLDEWEALHAVCQPLGVRTEVDHGAALRLLLP